MPDDPFAPLYPAAAERMAVATRMLVPRRPRPIASRGNTGSFEDFYAPECRLAEFTVTGTDDRIAVIDKAFPHARYDFMYVVANDDIRCAPDELADSTLATMLDAVPEFVRFVTEPGVRHRYGLEGSTLTFGFNHDRDTVDRDNGQFYEKRFHLHFNCWAARDLVGIRSIRFGDVADPRTKRTMLDPISFLGPSVLYEALRQQFPGEGPHGARTLEPDPERDAVLGLPLGLKLELPGWDYLATADCRRLIQDLHVTAERTYRDLHLAFTGAEPPARAWYRSPLLPPAAVAARLAALPYLSPATRDLLAVLRAALRDAEPADMSALRRDHDLAATRLALAGLDYHLGVYSPAPVGRGTPDGPTPIYLYLQFKLLSRIGGGPAVGGAAAVQVDRAGGPAFTEQESLDRRSLLETFTELRLARLERLSAIENVVRPAGPLTDPRESS
ncbi:hypothetical protein [Kitasatospora sp. NPDC058046]|uniref:hypothetical protein n=1 Tax=Kitasatospora sp. NPDC058046 TaxID=3346312 RepID=UPI0036D78EAA